MAASSFFEGAARYRRAVALLRVRIERQMKIESHRVIRNLRRVDDAVLALVEETVVKEGCGDASGHGAEERAPEPVLATEVEDCNTIHPSAGQRFHFSQRRTFSAVTDRPSHQARSEVTRGIDHVTCIRYRQHYGNKSAGLSSNLSATRMRHQFPLRRSKLLSRASQWKRGRCSDL